MNYIAKYLNEQKLKYKDKIFFKKEGWFFHNLNSYKHTIYINENEHRFLEIYLSYDNKWDVVLFVNFKNLKNLNSITHLGKLNTAKEVNELKNLLTKMRIDLKWN